MGPKRFVIELNWFSGFPRTKILVCPVCVECAGQVLTAQDRRAANEIWRLGLDFRGKAPQLAGLYAPLHKQLHFHMCYHHFQLTSGSSWPPPIAFPLQSPQLGRPHLALMKCPLNTDFLCRLEVPGSGVRTLRLHGRITVWMRHERWVGSTALSPHIIFIA